MAAAMARTSSSGLRRGLAKVMELDRFDLK
jgi:hypothetical protein